MAKDTHDILREVIRRARCKPGWHFHLVESEEDGLRLRIQDTQCLDTYSPEPHRPMVLNHYFPVPTATYNVETWVAWVFECCLKVEQHELGEWFRDMVTGQRPFAPLHGPGEDPYRVHQHRPDLAQARLTTQDGSMRQDPDNQPLPLDQIRWN
jgi:hypothetical protein